MPGYSQTFLRNELFFCDALELHFIAQQFHFPLANTYFAMQSSSMETDWAAEHLQTIRTLMERSAVYRRALAPIMVWNGIVGIGGGLVGWKLALNSGRIFILFWSLAALLAIIGSFILVRRQALKDSEAFWSPPTRRIAQALFPPLFIGAFLNCYAAYMASLERGDSSYLAFLLMLFWLFLYGCAANAAAFFMTRGMKLFGWIFIATGCAVLVIASNHDWPFGLSPHLLMAATFGGLHLAYGIYLYLTEKGKNAA
jgi:hypothetical protein